jgi:hypothetical protein
MFETCFEIFLSLSLPPSFLFTEIRWQKEEEKNSEKKGGEEKKRPNRTPAAQPKPSS